MYERQCACGELISIGAPKDVMSCSDCLPDFRDCVECGESVAASRLQSGGLCGRCSQEWHSAGETWDREPAQDDRDERVD